MRKRLKFWLAAASVAALAATPIALSSGQTQAAVHHTAPARIHLVGPRAYPGGRHHAIDCAASSAFCTEVANSRKVFGYYVGHDEPSMLFDSNVPGAGNHMRYNIVLPTDPPAANPNKKSYQFELSGADWLGMAMCDTQSYPEQVKTCPADSDKNILDPAKSPKHVGQAYM
jgi:hypothetical protein